MPAETPVRTGERVRAPVSHARPLLGRAPGVVIAVTSHGVIVEFDRPAPGVIPGEHHGTVVALEQFERGAEAPPTTTPADRPNPHPRAGPAGSVHEPSGTVSIRVGR
jgi:hypothetical protein